MKKLLAAGILFFGINCFASESGFMSAGQLESLRALALVKASIEVPTRLCVKAIQSDKNNIAAYIGTKFIGPT